MERPIIGFRTDDEGHWVARLDCGHAQHVRHTPPFMNRPWVMSEAGRASRLGQRLDCVRCDAAELPAEFVAYKRTPIFDAATVPAGLRRNHSTRAGVWARIVVLDGALRYHVAGAATVQDLSRGRGGVVVPEVLHHVEPVGTVRFYVEFYRAADPTG